MNTSNDNQLIIQTIEEKKGEKEMQEFLGLELIPQITSLNLKKIMNTSNDNQLTFCNMFIMESTFNFAVAVVIYHFDKIGKCNGILKTRIQELTDLIMDGTLKEYNYFKYMTNSEFQCLYRAVCKQIF